MSKKNKELTYRLVLERLAEFSQEEENLGFGKIEPMKRFVEFINFKITPDEAIEIMSIIVRMRERKKE